MTKKDHLKTFFQKNIQPKIDQINNKYLNVLLNEKFINDFNNADKAYLNAHQTYKTDHNEIKYFFSAIWYGLTFFPLCGLFHKKAKTNYLNLKENKNQLINNINEQQKKKLDIHHQITNYLIKDEQSIYFNYLKEIFKILNIQEIGYINDTLIKQLKSQILIEYNNDENPYKTHWSVFDDNKIVLNVAKQKHYMINKEYSGSRMVSLTCYDSNNRPYTKSERLVAYHVEPYPVFKYKYQNHFFMQSCSNLEFYLKKIYSGFFKKISSKKQIKLENQQFEKMFDFRRNDEVQFRMIFTILLQEILVNEVEANKQQNISNKPLYFQKTSSFLTNNVDDYLLSKQLNDLMLEIFSDFIKNVNVSYTKFIKNIKKNLQDFIYKKYLAYLPGFMIPIFVSENHTNIIKYSKNKNNFNNYLGYYCWFNLFGQDLLKEDTDTFYKIINKSMITTDFYQYQINALTYNRYPRQIVKYVYSSLTNRNEPVTVYYDEFIPKSQNVNLYVSFLDNQEVVYSNDYYIEKQNKALDNKIIELQKKYQLNKLKIIIKKSIISIIDISNKIDANKIYEFVTKLKEMV